MLSTLTIHNFVLIDRVHLTFENGFTIFTGETGAGKSILLDALSLALGARAQGQMVAAGQTQATICAELTPTPEIHAQLLDHGIEPQDTLILKRVLDHKGPSRAFINDHPVGLSLLRKIGESLIEIEGQFDTHRLLQQDEQRACLDGYGDLQNLLKKTQTAYSDWKEADKNLIAFQQEIHHFKANNAYLRESLEELTNLNPIQDEEAQLTQKRTLLKNQQHFAESLQRIQNLLEGDKGTHSTLHLALTEIERIAPKGEGLLDPLLEALRRTSLELEDALVQVQAFNFEDANGDSSLEEIEDRLHALRQVARKHGVSPDDLPNLRETLATRLINLDHSDEKLIQLEKVAQQKREAYQERAEALHEKRMTTALTFDKRVMAELPPLKLDKALFRTTLTQLPESQWGPHGFTHVAFEIAPNQGSSFGPLDQVASGGELSRLKLAIRVVLHEKLPKSTLIFDEIDSGMGGATADAVGERLQRLSQNNQVIAVTHSPQVAAKSDYHWLVTKASLKDQTYSRVIKLSADDQIYEIARMLSGAEVTAEATAAARKLRGVQAA